MKLFQRLLQHSWILLITTAGLSCNHSSNPSSGELRNEIEARALLSSSIVAEDQGWVNPYAPWLDASLATMNVGATRCVLERSKGVIRCRKEMEKLSAQWKAAYEFEMTSKEISEDLDKVVALRIVGFNHGPHNDDGFVRTFDYFALSYPEKLVVLRRFAGISCKTPGTETQQCLPVGALDYERQVHFLSNTADYKWSTVYQADEVQDHDGDWQLVRIESACGRDPQGSLRCLRTRLKSRSYADYFFHEIDTPDLSQFKVESIDFAIKDEKNRPTLWALLLGTDHGPVMWDMSSGALTSVPEIASPFVVSLSRYVAWNTPKAYEHEGQPWPYEAECQQTNGVGMRFREKFFGVEAQLEVTKDQVRFLSIKPSSNYTGVTFGWPDTSLEIRDGNLYQGDKAVGTISVDRISAEFSPGPAYRRLKLEIRRSASGSDLHWAQTLVYQPKGAICKIATSGWMKRVLR